MQESSQPTRFNRLLMVGARGRTYLRPVKAYRDGHGRARHRQIAQLGRADEPATRDKLDSLQYHTGTEASDPPSLHFDPARTLGRVGY